MALELFKPFIFHKLEVMGLATTIKAAKRMVESPGAGGVGHPRGRDPRAPGAAQPRADAAPPRHPGLRAGADRGQGDPAASARLRGVQRRLRRRPDGRPRAHLARGADGGEDAHALVEQRAAHRARRAGHRALAGHRAGPVLRHPRARERARRGLAVHQRGRSQPRLRVGRRRAARQDHGAHQGVPPRGVGGVHRGDRCATRRPSAGRSCPRSCRTACRSR